MYCTYDVFVLWTCTYVDTVCSLEPLKVTFSMYTVYLEVQCKSNVYSDPPLSPPPVGVCRLKHLVRLSLSHNLLTSLAALAQASLPDLQLLNVSNNKLTSLGGVEGCPALLELYVGGNLITNTREVLTLKVRTYVHTLTHTL